MTSCGIWSAVKLCAFLIGFLIQCVEEDPSHPLLQGGIIGLRIYNLGAQRLETGGGQCKKLGSYMLQSSNGSSQQRNFRELCQGERDFHKSSEMLRWLDAYDHR